MRRVLFACVLAGCAAAPDARDANTSDAAIATDALGMDASTCGDGGCPDTQTDPRSCGAVGHACRAFERCTQGTCACPASDAWCGAGGYATFALPDPSTMTTSYVVEQDVVRDQISGLVWERATTPTKRTWTEAVVYCETLVLAGRDDYRLPTRVELVSILDPTRTPSTATAFGTWSDYYWTASRPAFLDDYAYSIYFGLGEVVTASVATPGAYARCVAGGTRLGGFETTSVTVRDIATGLVWERTPHAPATHEAAVDACAASTLDGRVWRLPTAGEAMTIVDEARDPALDEEVFGAQSDAWTATLRDFGDIVAWIVRFDVHGTLELVPLDGLHDFRCVSPP